MRNEGMRGFLRKYPQAKPYLICGQGMPLEEAFPVDGWRR